MDILEACDSIANFIRKEDEDSFCRKDLMRSAVLQKLLVIGEAAHHVSKKLRSRHAPVPWNQIVGFRNLAIHAYFSVDWRIIWNAASSDAPMLRNQIAAILDSEPPEK